MAGQGRGLRIWAEALECQATGLRRKGLVKEAITSLPPVGPFLQEGRQTDEVRAQALRANSPAGGDPACTQQPGWGLSQRAQVRPQSEK